MSEATISSLIRTAAKDEALFVETSQNVLDDESLDRIAEFFDRLNIPRSVGSDANLTPLPSLTVTVDRIGTFKEEKAISDGIQKFLDRHARKIKWHATHPSLEGSHNVMLVTRCGIMATNVRIARLEFLLRRGEELTPEEWANAREFMNKAYLSFRNFLVLLAGIWIDAMQTAVTHDQLAETLGNFYEFIDTQIRKLEEARERIEDRRMELTVIPEEFPPVKPPVYFGGDLMGRGPWKQFWATIDSKAHHFRELAG